VRDLWPVFGSSALALPTGGSAVRSFQSVRWAAGSWSQLLYWVTSGATLGSAGIRFQLLVGGLGLLQCCAAVYQTRIEAGEFLAVVVHRQIRVKFSCCQESAGGEEIHTNGDPLPLQTLLAGSFPSDLSQ